MKSFVVICLLVAVAAALPTEEMAKEPAMEEAQSQDAGVAEDLTRDKRGLIAASPLGLGYASAYSYAPAHAIISPPWIPSVPVARSIVSPWAHSWVPYSSSYWGNTAGIGIW